MLFMTALVAVVPITFISVYMLSRYWAAFTFLPFLLPKKKFKHMYVLPVFNRFVFTFFGVGPFMTYIMLYTNFFFAANPGEIVKPVDTIEKGSQSYMVTYSDDSFTAEPWLRSFRNKPSKQKDKTWYGYYRTKSGILGFDILVEKELIQLPSQ